MDAVNESNSARSTWDIGPAVLIQYDLLSHPKTAIFIGLFLAVVLSRTSLFSPPDGNRRLRVPIHGPADTIRARWQFFRNALTLVTEGYNQHKHEIFKLSGHDIVVVPNKYVTELKSMPDDQISSIQANIDNFEGLYSTTAILLEGNLHTRTIQARLTPRLRHHVPVVQEVLTRHFPKELPATSEEYTAVPAFHLVLRLVSLIAARHFVGSSLCEDEEWLSTALTYTENAFKTIIFLRIFPDWLKPIVAFFMPFSWRVTWALRKAKRIIVPLIQERRVKKEADIAMRRAQGQLAVLEGDSYDTNKPEDFLQYMMDAADNERDAQPERLAHRLLILTLAAVHTTSMAVTQTLFSLCAHPEYVEPLREEVKSVLDREGGVYTKQTLTHFYKLDSFMRESQRLNPPSLLGFKRAVRKPTTLEDGTYLPKGTHLMMPIYPIVIDPEVVGPDPLKFDGFRHYRKRQLEDDLTEPDLDEKSRNENRHRHQFATTSETNLHFGHGKYACPGRFLAGNTIKMILSNMLLRYDFRFPGGSTERPGNVHLHEYVFPNPDACVEFKLRDGFS